MIYFYRPAKLRIYLILAYPKNARESISDSEKRRIRTLTAALEAEP